MVRFSTKRILASAALIVFGFGYFVLGPFGHFAPLELACWIVPGASVGAGIYNLSGRPIKGAIVGLAVWLFVCFTVTFLLPFLLSR